MFRQNMMLLLVGHVIGDFYVQTKRIADKKEQSIKWVLVHCFWYLVSMLAVSIPVISVKIAVIDLCVAILHLIIDVGKYYFLQCIEKQRKMNPSMSRNVFLTDQILHLCSLVIVAYWMTETNIVLSEMKFFADFFAICGMSETAIGTWILSLLIIHKPANILIQKIIGNYKPENSGGEFKKDNNAGRVIGTVERLVMLILLSIGQYSAIGLVLTAKSIARYDRISKDEVFAEYYLLGTLMSAAIVIICANILL